VREKGTFRLLHGEGIRVHPGAPTGEDVCVHFSAIQENGAPRSEEVETVEFRSAQGPRLPGGQRPCARQINFSNQFANPLSIARGFLLSGSGWNINNQLRRGVYDPRRSMTSQCISIAESKGCF